MKTDVRRLNTRSTILLSSLLGVLAGLAVVLATARSVPLQAESIDRPMIEIDSWSTSTPLPQSLASRNAIVHGDYVFLFGGKDANGRSLDTIYTSQIQPAGGLGLWSLNPEPMPEPLYIHSIAVFNNFVYLIGGWNNSEGVSSLDRPNEKIWRGQLTNDGRVTNWTLLGSYTIDNVPTKITLHQAIVIGQRLFVIGGYANDDSIPIANVSYANLNAVTGDIGTWQTGPELPRRLRRFSATSVIKNGVTYVYVIGGSGENTDSAFDTVYYSAVDGNGLLGSWQSSSSTLPDGRTYHASLIHDGRLLVIGGRNSAGQYGTVLAANIRDDGSLGNWTGLVTLPETRYRFAAVKVARHGSDYVVVLGGYTASGDSEVAHDTTFISNLPTLTTPAPTATPTSTPTPPPSIQLEIKNSPPGWIAQGEEIEYVINYSAGDSALSNVEIASKVPSSGGENWTKDKVALVLDSLTDGSGSPGTLSESGRVIQWALGDLQPGDSGQLSYRVIRVTAEPPGLQPLPVIIITVSGPATVSAGIPFEYEITVENTSPLQLTDVRVTNALPYGSTYISGASGAPINGQVEWMLPVLPPLGSEMLTYSVVANRTVINYRAEATFQDGATIVGSERVVTRIEDTEPLVGDDFTVIQEGVQATWDVNGTATSIKTEQIINPTFKVYIPSLFPAEFVMTH